MLRIVGDINLTDGYFDVGFGIGSKLKRGFDPFQHVQRNKEDCWIGNFEGVASETSERIGSAAMQFRVHPDSLAHIKHFDVYGVANNHAMQHGVKAYQRTFDFLTSQGCICFGSNSVRSQVFVHQDRIISITGFSQRIDAFSDNPCYWYNPEYKDIEREINRQPQDAYRIAFVHWGNEFINRPSSPQKKFAHWLVDAGFDIVIGMHPHVLQGYEKYNNKYIFYSLGNFVFDMPWEPTKYGAIISLDMTCADIIPSISYVKINKAFAPVPVEDTMVPERFRFEFLNQRLVIEDNTEEYHNEIVSCYKQYRKDNHKDIIYKMIKHPRMISSTLKDYIKRKL